MLPCSDGSKALMKVSLTGAAVAPAVTRCPKARALRACEPGVALGLEPAFCVPAFFAGFDNHGLG